MRFLLILFVVLTGIFFISCSSDNPLATDEEIEAEPPVLSIAPDLIITFPTEFSPDIYYTAEIVYQEETITAYPLEQLIPNDITGSVNLEDPIDLRPLYAYHVVASDFDPRDRSHIIADLHWSIFSEGHYLPDPINRVFFSLLPSTLGAYNVRTPEIINVYRKIDVILGEGDPVMFETEAMATIPVNYNEVTFEAVPMTAFITEYITATPGSHTYLLTDLYNQQQSLSWEELSNYYYLPVEDLVIYLGTKKGFLTEEMIISKLYSIELNDL